MHEAVVIGAVHDGADREGHEIFSATAFEPVDLGKEVRGAATDGRTREKLPQQSGRLWTAGQGRHRSWCHSKGCELLRETMQCRVLRAAVPQAFAGAHIQTQISAGGLQQGAYTLPIHIGRQVVCPECQVHKGWAPLTKHIECPGFGAMAGRWCDGHAQPGRDGGLDGWLQCRHGCRLVRRCWRGTPQAQMHLPDQGSPTAHREAETAKAHRG